MSARRTVVAASVAVAAATIGLAAPAGAATPSAPSPHAAACDHTAWEAKVQGTPHVKSGAPSGDYLWHDSHGFHLRVTHAHHEQRVYSGTITSSAAMRIDPVRLEKGDTVRLSANHRTLVFVFADHGYIDGVNFHTYCASRLTVSRLHVGNADLGRRHVYLGATKTHPAAVPFTVHRRPVAHT